MGLRSSPAFLVYNGSWIVPAAFIIITKHSGLLSSISSFKSIHLSTQNSYIFVEWVNKYLLRIYHEQGTGYTDTSKDEKWNYAFKELTM